MQAVNRNVKMKTGRKDVEAIFDATRAGKLQKNGQVITHNHETSQQKLLASPIRERLSALPNGLEDETTSFDQNDWLV